MDVKHASTILETLETLDFHQPSSTLYGGNLSNLKTEILKETLCHVYVQRCAKMNPAEITAGDVGPDLGHSWFHFHGGRGHKAHI